MKNELIKILIDFQKEATNQEFWESRWDRHEVGMWYRGWADKILALLMPKETVTSLKDVKG